MSELDTNVFDMNIEAMDGLLDYVLGNIPSGYSKFHGSWGQTWVMMLNTLILAQTEMPYNSKILVLSDYVPPVSKELFPFSCPVFRSYDSYVEPYDERSKEWDKIIVISNSPSLVGSFHLDYIALEVDSDRS